MPRKSSHKAVQPEPRMPTQAEEYIERSIELLLRSKILLGGFQISLPSLALDDALKINPDYQSANSKLRDATNRLGELVNNRVHYQVFDLLETAIQELINSAATVSWQMALLAAYGKKEKQE